MIEIIDRMTAWFEDCFVPPNPEQVYERYREVCQEVLGRKPRDEREER
jgi:hypothetical protein